MHTIAPLSDKVIRAAFTRSGVISSAGFLLSSGVICQLFFSERLLENFTVFLQVHVPVIGPLAYITKNRSFKAV